MYKFLEHPADIKILVEEETIEKAFSESTLALKESISGKIKVKEKVEKKIEVEGSDLENLFYNFIEEFLFLLDSKGFLFSKVKDIKIDENQFKLNATILGDEAKNYKFSNDVKAITYNEMFIKKNKKVEIQFVLDA